MFGLSIQLAQHPRKYVPDECHTIGQPKHEPFSHDQLLKPSLRESCGRGHLTVPPRRCGLQGNQEANDSSSLPVSFFPLALQGSKLTASLPRGCQATYQVLIALAGIRRRGIKAPAVSLTRSPQPPKVPFTLWWIGLPPSSSAASLKLSCWADISGYLAWLRNLSTQPVEDMISLLHLPSCRELAFGNAGGKPHASSTQNSRIENMEPMTS